MLKFIKKLADSERFRDSFSTPEKLKKSYKKIGVALLILLSLPKLVPAISALLPNDGSGQAAGILAVDIAHAVPEKVNNTLTSTGTLKARYEIDLSAEVAGKITELHIGEGSSVKAGELLLKINDNDLQADLSRIQANIEVMIESENRQRQLFERGGATQEEYDATRIQLNNLRAEMAAIEARIQRTEVIAPFDGVLGLAYVDEGSYITPDTRIATLRDLSSVRIDFSVPERYSNRIRTGSEVNFSVQGVDSVFVGQVHAVEPGIDPRSRTVNIRAVSENPEGQLRSGAFANIELILETHENALTVPAISLLPDMGEYKVLVYEDGRVSERPVQTGIRMRDRVQVTSGLKPGDSVLVNGLLQVRDGMEVEIRSVVR